MEENKTRFMRAALDEAKQAALIGEVPIGAVVVHDNKIIGRGHNLREHSNEAGAHAEMIAIMEANHVLKSWRLIDCDLYVTVEPCPMCSGALINSQIKTLYFGARNPKAGTVKSLYELLSDDRFNHQVQVEEGLLAEEATSQMQSFFRTARRKRKFLKKQRAGGEKTGNSLNNKL